VGGTPPYTSSLASGSGPLPPGLSFGPANSNGITLTGTPTTAGTYAFTVSISDSNVAEQQTITQSFTVTIVAGGPVTGFEAVAATLNLINN
jgi:hypothetical protein